MRSTRALVALVVVGGALLLGLGQAAGAATASAAPDPAHTVRVLKLDGAVDPFMASYLTRNIHAADDAHDAAVLIEIDTPGGLDSSMRTITKAILNSPVPVLCWTGPSGGARAASAGTFIMLACPWNAMAPGTEIGAAHPVGVAGAIEDAKVTADAVGFIQSLARQWGRDPAWAKSAVTLKGEQASISAQDAVNNKPPVADFPASSPQEFLNDVDGRTTGPNGEGGQARPVAHVAGADLVTEQMGLGAGLLHALIDPSLVFLFFYAGIILIVIELLHPGVSVPGVVGTLLLVVSIVSLGMLPVQLGGVILLVASAVLYLLELKHPGIGLPAIGGTVCLVLGGLLLFDPSVPNARVSRWLLLIVPTVAVAFFGFVAQAVLETRRLPALQQRGGDLLIGAQGMALEALDPHGQVYLGHETWSAESVAGPIPKGTPVRVVRRAGLTLLVEPATILPAGPGQSLREEGS